MLCIWRMGHLSVISIADMNYGLFKDANSFEGNNQEPKCGHIREFMMTMKPNTESSDDSNTSTDSTWTSNSKQLGALVIHKHRKRKRQDDNCVAKGWFSPWISQEWKSAKGLLFINILFQKCWSNNRWVNTTLPLLRKSLHPLNLSMPPCTLDFKKMGVLIDQVLLTYMVSIRKTI